MPFTLAHPAAVLPLRRTRLVFSALVVGSLAPDFPYFVLLTERPSIGHSIEGVFRFCLPASLAVLWLYHVVVKRPLVALAPTYIRARINESDLEFRFGPLPRFLRILGSILIGTFTHILWDGFTHDHGAFVKLWPLLRERVPLHNHAPIYKLLQLGCSALGLAIVVWVIWEYWRAKPLATIPASSVASLRGRILLVVAMFSIALVVGWVAAVHYDSQPWHGWKWSLVEGVIDGIVTINAEILLYSLLWHASRRAENKKLPNASAREFELSSKR